MVSINYRYPYNYHGFPIVHQLGIKDTNTKMNTKYSVIIFSISPSIRKILTPMEHEPGHCIKCTQGGREKTFLARPDLEVHRGVF